MKDFKFFKKPDKIFPEWMDRMDDHILGNQPPMEDCVVVGTTPIIINPRTFEAQRNILYRNITTNEIIKGEIINPGHLYWNTINETI